MSDAIYLTVVVPVRNEEKCIRQTLEDMASQDYPKQRYEILVVDGRSTDATRAVVDHFVVEHPDVNVRLLDNPRHLSSSGRNIGARTATGRLVAVIDGHVVFSEEKPAGELELQVVQEDRSKGSYSGAGVLAIWGCKPRRSSRQTRAFLDGISRAGTRTASGSRSVDPAPRTSQSSCGAALRSARSSRRRGARYAVPGRHVRQCCSTRAAPG